jgi:hypothetical protein
MHDIDILNNIKINLADNLSIIKGIMEQNKNNDMNIIYEETFQSLKLAITNIIILKNLL